MFIVNNAEKNADLDSYEGVGLSSCSAGVDDCEKQETQCLTSHREVSVDY